MATTYFDLVVAPVTSDKVDRLTSDQREQLERKPEVADKKEKRAGARRLTAAELTPPQPVTPFGQLSMSDYAEAYRELILEHEAVLDRSSERVGDDLVLEYRRSDRPELAMSTEAVFGQVTEKITYDLYLEALRISRDLAIEIGTPEGTFQ